MPPRVGSTGSRAARALALLVCLAAVLPGIVARSDPAAPGLQDFIAPPGTRQVARPALLHADLTTGYDRRAPLDTVVYALENGARCCRVPTLDSVWVVDYTWIYPHRGMPPRWYDAEDLLRVGDSLGLNDSSSVVFTFGTYRLGVHAGSFEQASAEAKRLRPAVMPPALAGRLRLKLERAREALAREAAGAPGGAPRP
jgi:hypothetical protein